MDEAHSLAELRLLCAQPLPHPDEAWMRDAGEQILDYLVRDYLSLPQRPLGRTAGREEMESLLRESPPECGAAFEQVFDNLQKKIAPYSLRPQHPRFTAFIPSAPTFLSVLGDWLCAGLNFFAGVWKEAPGAAEVEIVVLDWFKEFLGYPAGAGGVLTNGGSEANLIALVTARECIPFANRALAMIYHSEQRHHSIDRAAKVMGLGPGQICCLPVDDYYRLDLDHLHLAIAEDRRAGRWPWLVVANAGATNTGSVDPLPQIADLCRRENLWLHVDGAYGWPAVLTEEGRAQLHGIDQADSLTLDPHKWFAQTFEAGCVLVRDGRLLTDTFQYHADYMQDVVPKEEEVNFADRGIALTRRFRALKIWFSLKLLGVGWFRRLIDHCLRLTELAQRVLEQAGDFEILSPRQLSIVCFRYRPKEGPRDDDEVSELNLKLCEAIMASGAAFLSTTRLRSRVALRFCFVNSRTTAQDVEEMIRIMQVLGKDLLLSRA